MQSRSSVVWSNTFWGCASCTSSTMYLTSVWCLVSCQPTDWPLSRAMLKIGMLCHHRWCSRCNLKYKGSTCDQDHMLWLQMHICDWTCTYVTRDAHLWLELHIGDVICDWSHKCVTGVAIVQLRSRKFIREHAHQNSIYNRPFGPDFSFPSHVLLYL